MGDRANIAMQFDGGGQVWFYTHWCGTEMESTLREALNRGRNRWDDPAYLSRIIFCEMIKMDGKDALDGLTGFGISTSEQDQNHPHIYVDTSAKTVKMRDGTTHSFEDYCKSEVSA